MEPLIVIRKANVHASMKMWTWFCRMQNRSAMVSAVLLRYNRNIDKWANRTMAISVRALNCSELFNKNKLKLHIHMYTGQRSSNCSTFEKVSVLKRKKKKHKHKLLSIMIRARDWSRIKCCAHPKADGMALCLWQCRTISMTFIYLLIFFFTLIHVSRSFFLPSSMSFSPCGAVFSFLYMFVLAFMCTSIIVCSTLSLLLLLLLPLFFILQYCNCAVGSGCAKIASVYCYCLFYSSLSEMVSVKDEFSIPNTELKRHEQSEQRKNMSCSFRQAQKLNSSMRMCKHD